MTLCKHVDTKVFQANIWYNGFHSHIQDTNSDMTNMYNLKRIQNIFQGNPLCMK